MNVVTHYENTKAGNFEMWYRIISGIIFFLLFLFDLNELWWDTIICVWEEKRAVGELMKEVFSLHNFIFSPLSFKSLEMYPVCDYSGLQKVNINQQ